MSVRVFKVEKYDTAIFSYIIENLIEVWLGTATANTETQALFKATGGIRSDETFNDFTLELS